MLEIYIVVLIILITSLISQKHQINKRRIQALRRIRGSWGKLPENNYDEYDLQSFTQLYRFYEKKHAQRFIDDITWNDLELDSFYTQINSTLTSMGDHVLYSMLRTPLYEKEKLNERTEMIDYWDQHPEERENIQVLLANTGKFRPSYIGSLTGDCDFLELSDKLGYKILTFLPFLALPFLLINIWMGALWGILCIGINVLYHEWMMKKVHSGLEAVTQTTRIVSLAENLVKNRPEGLTEEFSILSDLFDALKPILNKGAKESLLLSYSGDIIRDLLSIFNMIFLIDIWKYQSSIAFLKKHNEEMTMIIKAIGEVDAAISIASYRKSLALWCRPQIIWESKGESINIKAEAVVHPLINDCTPNPVLAEKPLLLTGCNASGKSTYLKTVAINTLLVHTLGFCLASHWISKPLFPVTSMALRDNVLNGESYFIAEIKSLKRIFLTAEDKIRCLCVIDEVLRGTNTIERIAASSRLLNALTQYNTWILAATHDLELTDILKNVYENKHFEEMITDEDIRFDYKIKEGKATTRNAIKLLKLMSFEDDIIISAEKAVESFEDTKYWSNIKGEVI